MLWGTRRSILLHFTICGFVLFCELHLLFFGLEFRILVLLIIFSRSIHEFHCSVEMIFNIWLSHGEGSKNWLKGLKARTIIEANGFGCLMFYGYGLFMLCK